MDGLKSECLGGFRLEEVDGFVGIRNELMGQGKFVAIEPVVAHQEPAGQPLSDIVRAVAGGRLSRLDVKHLSKAQQEPLHGRALLQGLTQGIGSHAQGRPANLHEGFVRGLVGSQQHRHSGEAVPTDETNLDPASALRAGDNGGHAGLEEVDMLNRRMGLNDYVALCKRNRFKTVPEQSEGIRRQRCQQAIANGGLR
jgi:hypothetical protein